MKINFIPNDSQSIHYSIITYEVTVGWVLTAGCGLTGDRAYGRLGLTVGWDLMADWRFSAGWGLTAGDGR